MYEMWRGIAIRMARRRSSLVVWLFAVAVCIGVLGATQTAAAPVIWASVFEHTGIRLTDVVWTGTKLLYVENTTNAVWAAGSPPTLFVSMPRVVEQTRCAAAPGAHGFSAGSIYCHSPDNVIYRIDSKGKVSVFARLLRSPISDGAIAFDTDGSFGFRLLVATGRSGTPTDGGTVYAVDPLGVVTRIGSYSSSTGGGADELTVAPRHFGRAQGQIVLTVDAGSRGALVLMDSRGRTRQIATLPDGPNPLVVIPRASVNRRFPLGRGLYFTDTNSTNVFYVAASALARYAGDLVVGTEIKGSFWAVSPHGTGFRTRQIPLNLPGRNFNLEGGAYIG